MSEYNPDNWVMVKFNHNGDIIYKILASWYGGFARGDSWKLNSGVTRIEEDGQCYLFHGSSGSVYRCHKGAYGMSAYTMSILSNFQKQVEDMDNVTLELLTADTNFMEIDYAAE